LDKARNVRQQQQQQQGLLLEPLLAPLWTCCPAPALNQQCKAPLLQQTLALAHHEQVIVR
jgi:hypothetical protein